MENTTQTLAQQISEKSKDISTETLQMSIGEIVNMYKDGDLDIHPEFQRFYRWSDSQKSKLIESILLNIPIPAIFVSQKEDGIWDVVDGLQRLSTILEFVGEYKSSEDKKLPPLKLQGTKLLSKLKNVYYDDFPDKDNDGVCLDPEIKRYFKRSKLLFIVIRKESDATGKYEIFQRLNTGGSSLSDQEVRNCLMVMENPQRFDLIEQASKYENFQNTLRLSDSDYEKRFDLELMVRFLCLKNTTIEEIRSITNFGEFLDDKILEIIRLDDTSFDREIKSFKDTFDLIYQSMGDEAFCKYDSEKQKFKGRFFTGAYEIIAIGLGRHQQCNNNVNIKNKVINMWESISNGSSPSWNGNSASGRLVKTLTLGDVLFGNGKD